MTQSLIVGAKEVLAASTTFGKVYPIRNALYTTNLIKELLALKGKTFNLAMLYCRMLKRRQAGLLQKGDPNHIILLDLEPSI